MSDKPFCRAEFILGNGKRAIGTVTGDLVGRCEFGKISIPWSSVKSVSFSSATRWEEIPLTMRSMGELSLQEDTRIKFVSWAPVVGDVITDTLLAEAPTGPHVLPLAQNGTMEIVGEDKAAFFWQYCIRLTPAAKSSERHFIALSYILACGDQGLLRVSPEKIASITWTGQ